MNHPEYDPETKANDVAIWKLVEPFSPSEFISFVTLPEPDFDPAPDSLITIAGWYVPTLNRPLRFIHSAQLSKLANALHLNFT